MVLLLLGMYGKTNEKVMSSVKRFLGMLDGKCIVGKNVMYIIMVLFVFLFPLQYPPI